MGRETEMMASNSALVATIENALVAHPGVLDSAVSPSREDLDGDRVGVVVVLSEMACVLDVREDLRAALDGAGHGAEPAVLAVARVPARLLAPIEELAGPSAVSRYEPPASELEEGIAARLASILGRPRVGVLDDFVDLGGDSLTAVAFLHAIQEAYDVPLSLVELFAAGTVREIARLLAERLTTSQRPR
ncbi:phosphopantetheine-binding protein [Streptomyces sp. NPDC052236]|uniref:phosphopantetheine-binding protein n=1 Tax=Streptomyces sp. NPDC052236 TaxID=3365686 RepID=UPI0037D27AFD